MLVKLRSAAVIAMIWIASVAGVSFTAWFAIDRAGRDLAGAAVGSLRPITLNSALGTSTPGPPSPTDTATNEPGAKDPSASSTPPVSPAPSGSPKASVSPGPPGASASGGSDRSSWQDRTVSVTGGQVSVRCTGATIVLRIAQPGDGWRVEVGESTPTRVVVGFRRGNEENGVETKVTAVCASGTPSFSAASDS